MMPQLQTTPPNLSVPAKTPTPNNNPSTNLSPLPPASLKPTSRGRMYRIPNTSGGGINTSAPGSTPESLWATREIAALDFLVNVPLRAERSIVRAGLNGERWHPSNEKNAENEVGDVDEENKGWTPVIRTMSTFGRRVSIEDEATTTASTAHSSLVGSAESRGGGGGMRWWDKLILKDKRFFSAANQQAQRRERLEMEERELERPDSTSLDMDTSSIAAPHASSSASAPLSAGRTVNIYHSRTNSAGEFIGGATLGHKGMGTNTAANATTAAGVPGRRLDGRDAITITIPDEFRPRPRTVARQATVREWEIRVAWHGVDINGAHLNGVNNPPGIPVSPPQTRKALLDGRVFFSARKSYPTAVFSTIKYEPQKEEAARRRKKLEELGGGGTQFVLPERDWRGISYQALLPQTEKENKAFNRLIRSSPPINKDKLKTSPEEVQASSGDDSSDDRDDDTASLSSEESGTYVPGFLDDPQMVQGRHRHVMVGDKVTGPIVSSTIQFVKPSVLKADLNKQFRERFDKWEPPKSQRKFIGAKIIDGVYTLIDPTEVVQEDADDDTDLRRQRSESVTGEREMIRMPPSLTLSKIRSLKQQALLACVRSKIEISTLALACTYFERLCLDCRVDKSNRRLSFAACLLLAAKVNESNSMIAFDRGVETKQSVLHSWIKPSRRSGKIFESLIVFFTHDWSLSLKQLYAAEWIVFTVGLPIFCYFFNAMLSTHALRPLFPLKVLGFSLSATPSQVAFHFRRLLKVLEWNPISYLGPEMYGQWQESLMEESLRKDRRKARRELRIKRNERKLLKLQRKLQLQQSEEMTNLPSSASGSDAMNRSDGSIFRRHSIGSSFIHVDSNEETSMVKTPEIPQLEDSENPTRPGGLFKAEGPPAKRGLLSRLARTKQASLDKDLDKFPKIEKRVMRQSVSVPNFGSPEEINNADVAIDFTLINEDDGNDGKHAEESEGGANSHTRGGMFV